MACLIALGLSATACHHASTETSSSGDGGVAVVEPASDGHGPATVDLDVSTGGAPEHLAMTAKQIAKLDPNDLWIRFTLSQSNEHAPGDPARQTLSLQSHQAAVVGKEFGADGHLLQSGEIFTSTKQCIVQVTRDDPMSGPQHLHWVEGTFSCDELKTQGKDPKVARITGGHFSGRFVSPGGA